MNVEIRFMGSGTVCFCLYLVDWRYWIGIVGVVVSVSVCIWLTGGIGSGIVGVVVSVSVCIWLTGGIGLGIVGVVVSVSVCIWLTGGIGSGIVGGVSYTPSTWLRIENYLYNPGYPHEPDVLYDTAMFYVDLRNYGVDDASGVKVNVTIPSGYSVLTFNPKVGTYNTTTNVWDVGNVCNGAWAYLDIVLKVITSNTTLSTNTSVTQNEVNPNPKKNSAAIISVLPASALQLKQTVSNKHPSTGSQINFLVTVTNNGPQDMLNLKLQYLLPLGLGYVNIVPYLGSYNNITGEWNVGTLQTGVSAILNITATINAISGTIIKNVINILSYNGIDVNQTIMSKMSTIQVRF